MKFAHLADCHIGAWREPKLQTLSMRCFSYCISTIIEEQCDFVLIAGDLFNTSLPALDKLKKTVHELTLLRKAGIPVYLIAGSHDYSPSGKTMLDVLEAAGLFVNVTKGEVHNGKLKLSFTHDPQTGVKITGILGKKGMLDSSYYKMLDYESLEAETGKKIFMFHTAITEYKPQEFENIESAPSSFLPRGFMYQAGGHVHYIFDHFDSERGRIVYPGPTFPNSFSELEKLKGSGFFIVEGDEVLQTRRIPIPLYSVCPLECHATNKTAEEVQNNILYELRDLDLKNHIVTLRISGMLKEGKNSDIDWRSIFSSCYDKGALFVMKNTAKLTSQEYEHIEVHKGSIEDIEEERTQAAMGTFPQDAILIPELMRVLATEKKEGETQNDYEKRLFEEIALVEKKTEKLLVVKKNE